MATPAQIAANRANASRSTGPRSQDGKQTSSRNATKHGLYSDVICVPGEDQNAYNRLRDGLYSRHRPVGELEASLVDRILLAMWKLKRALAAEAKHYKRAQRELTDLDGYKRCAGPADVLAICLERTSIPAFERMQVQFQRMMDKALAELRKGAEGAPRARGGVLRGRSGRELRERSQFARNSSPDNASQSRAAAGGRSGGGRADLNTGSGSHRRPTGMTVTRAFCPCWSCNSEGERFDS